MSSRRLRWYSPIERKNWERFEKLVLLSKSSFPEESDTALRMAKVFMQNQNLKWDDRPLTTIDLFSEHFPNGVVRGKRLRDYFTDRDREPFAFVLDQIFRNNGYREMTTRELAQEAGKMGYTEDINKVSNTLQRSCSRASQYSGKRDWFRQTVRRGVWRRIKPGIQRVDQTTSKMAQAA